MELIMMEWVRRRNLRTTKPLTVYDFIAGSYILFGMTRRNGNKRLPRFGVNGLLVSIMKLVCCKLLSNLNRLCCVVFFGFVSIRTGQKFTPIIWLKSNFYDSVVIQAVLHLLIY